MQYRIPIVASKIQSPQIAPRFLPRAILSEWAESLAERRLISLVAPAGYGKTASMAALAGTAAASGRAVAWLSLDLADADPAFFLAYLIAAFDRALPGALPESARILMSVTDPAQEAQLVVAGLCEELWGRSAGSPLSAVLFLDDFHEVATAPPVNGCVRYLLANLPPGISICVASRSDPGLPTEKLALSGQLLRIGPRELAFSAEEGTSLLLDSHGLRITADDARKLVAETEGWVAGLVLAAQALRETSASVDAVQTLLSKQRGAAFDYFAGEVLGRLDPDLAGFLLRAANLRHVTAAACAEILSTPRAHGLLEEAVRCGLFVTRIAALEGTVYRFHHLFEACLRQVWLTQTAAADQRALHSAAAHFYARNGLTDAAIEHLLAGGDAAGAVGLLLREGRALIDQGRTEQVRRWLSALPADTVDSEPHLLYLKGFVHQHSDPPLALECLDRAADGLARVADHRLQVRALIHMATIYSLQNRVDEVNRVVARIPLVRALALDPWARGVLVVSALCQAAWDDNLQRGARLGRICRLLRLDEDWQWAMLAYSCMIHYRLGDLDQAGKLIDEGLSLPSIRTNDVWRGMGLVLKHVVLYSLDDEERAQPVREQLWDLGERYDSAYYKAYAMRTFAFPHVHRGRFDEARELLRSSLYFFDRCGNEGMSLVTRLDLANLEASAGKAAEALDDARMALGRLLSINPGQGLTEMGQSLFGSVACEAGAYAEAEHHLLASARTSKRKGARQILAGTYLHLARLYSLRGDDATADRYLRDAFAIASHGRYRVFWDWHRPTVKAMAERAITRRIYPSYAADLLRHWFGGAEGPSEPAGQSEPGSRVLPQLTVRLLGGFSLAVDGVTIPDRAWPTRKVKSLCKILILNRERRVSREELAELLWPEAEPESSAASLRVALTRLRQALNAVPGQAGASVVQAGQGYVWLRPESLAGLDSERFAASARAGLKAAAGGDREAAEHALGEALGLYHGDLLPDDLYDDWSTIQREQLQLLSLDATLALARLLAANDDRDRLDRAKKLLRDALRTDPYREETVLELMKTCVALGQREEAMVLFRDYRRRLAEEFGAIPGQRAAGLFDQLRVQ